MDTPNNSPTLKPSKSFYEKIGDLMGRSPATIISSICALFIVIILSIILPMYFPPNSKTNDNNNNNDNDIYDTSSGSTLSFLF